MSVALRQDRKIKPRRVTPNIVDHILNNQVQLIVNTPLGRESFFDDRAMRRVAMLHNVPCITTLTGASAAVEAIRALRTHALAQATRRRRRSATWAAACARP